MSVEGSCSRNVMTFSEPIVASVSCSDGYEQNGDFCEVITYASCAAEVVTYGDFDSQFSFLQQDHLASQASSNSFEASSSEFPEQIDFGTYQVDESLTRSCADGVSEYSNYSALETSLNCPAGEQDIGGVNYSFPLTAHNTTANLTGIKTIEGGQQNMSVEGSCSRNVMTFSEPIVASVSCSDGYEQNGDFCEVITYASCAAEVVTHGNFGSQFGFAELGHGESQVVSSSFVATAGEFPELVDFGSYQVDESLTSDCDDAARAQRDYTVGQTDMNCAAGSITYEGAVFAFARQAHDTVFSLSAEDDNDYNTTASSADFSCANTKASYSANFSQTVEHKQLSQATIMQALEDFYGMTQSSLEANVTFYATIYDANNNPYNVNYTNVKDENGLAGVVMGQVPDQPYQNVYVIGANPTGLAYLDFQTEDKGLTDVSILTSELVNNDSNVSGIIAIDSTLPEVDASIASLQQGDFVYTDKGLLVYVGGSGTSDNIYALRNQNYIERKDHGETKNEANIFSGFGPNYFFGVPFFYDNYGNFVEIKTNTGISIGNYNDGVFSLNQDLINVIEGIQKPDKSQIANASYSLAIPVSNTGDGTTTNLILGPFHKGIMAPLTPPLTKDDDGRVDLGELRYCSGNGTYSTEYDVCN